MKNATNTFSKGLIMDVHPMTAPQDSMSNALNATLLTYDGNEFILQNDNGNTKIDSAFLPTGYIPVGMKSYGGVIYVASYNPFTKMSQVGSFPSPQRLSHSTEKTHNVSVTNDDFSRIKNVALKDIFNSTIFNPGDEFAISIDLFDGEFPLPDGERVLEQLISKYGDGELSKFIKVEIVIDSENISPSDLIAYTNKYFALYGKLPSTDLFQVYKDGTSKLLLKVTLEGVLDFSTYSNVIGVTNDGEYTVEVVGTSSKYTKNNYITTVNGSVKLFGDRLLDTNDNLELNSSVQSTLYNYIEGDESVEYTNFTNKDLNGGELFSLKVESQTEDGSDIYVYGNCSTRLSKVLKITDNQRITFNVFGNYSDIGLIETILLLYDYLDVEVSVEELPVDAIYINNQPINFIGITQDILSLQLYDDTDEVKIYTKDGELITKSGSEFGLDRLTISHEVHLQNDTKVELLIEENNFSFQGTISDLISILSNPTAYYRDGYVAIRYFLILTKKLPTVDVFITPRSEQFEYQLYRQRLIIEPHKFNTNSFTVNEYQYFKLSDRILLKLNTEYYPKLGNKYKDLYIQFFNVELNTSIFWKVSDSVKSANGTFLLSFPLGDGLRNVDNSNNTLRVSSSDFPNALVHTVETDSSEQADSEWLLNSQYYQSESGFTLKSDSLYAIGIYLIEDGDVNNQATNRRIADKYVHRYMYTTSIFNEYYDIIPDFKDCLYKAVINLEVDKNITSYLGPEQTDPLHFYRHTYNIAGGQSTLLIEQSKSISILASIEIKNNLVEQDKYFGVYNKNCLTYGLDSNESMVAENVIDHSIFNTYLADGILNQNWSELPETVNKIHMKLLDSGVANKFEFATNPQFDSKVSRMWLTNLAKTLSKQQITNLVKPLWEWVSGINSTFDRLEANKVLYGVTKDNDGNFTLSGKDIITYGYDGVGYNSYEIYRGMLKSPVTGTKPVVDSGGSFLSQNQFNAAVLKAIKEVFGKDRYEELPLFVPVMTILRPENHYYDTHVDNNKDIHKVGYYHITSNDMFRNGSWDNDELALINRFGWCDRAGIDKNTELGTPVKWAINIHDFAKRLVIADGKLVFNYVVTLMMKDGNGSYIALPHEFPHIFSENYKEGSFHDNIMTFSDIIQMIAELYSLLYIVKPTEEVIDFYYASGYINDVILDSSLNFEYKLKFKPKQFNPIFTFGDNHEFALRVIDNIVGNADIPGNLVNIPTVNHLEDLNNDHYTLNKVDSINDVNIDINILPSFSDLHQDIINPELLFPQTNVAVIDGKIITDAVIPIVKNDSDLNNRFPIILKFNLETYNKGPNNTTFYFNLEVSLKTKPLKPNTVYLNFNNSIVKPFTNVPESRVPKDRFTKVEAIPYGIKSVLSSYPLESSLFCIFDGGIPVTEDWTAAIPHDRESLLYTYSWKITDEYKQLVSRILDHGGLVAIEDLALVSPLTYLSFGHRRSTLAESQFNLASNTSPNSPFSISKPFPINKFSSAPKTYRNHYYGGVFFTDRFYPYDENGNLGENHAVMNGILNTSLISGKSVYSEIIGMSNNKLIALSSLPYCIYKNIKKLSNPIRVFDNLNYLRYYVHLKPLTFDGMYLVLDISTTSVKLSIEKVLRKLHIYSEDNTIYFWSSPKYSVPTSFSVEGEQQYSKNALYIGPEYQPYISPFGCPTPSILYFPGYNFHYTPYYE